MNTRSVYFRLTAWYSSLVIVISLAFGAYIYRSVQGGLYLEIGQLFNNRIHSIASNILKQTYDPDEIARQISVLYFPESNNRFIRITRAAGVVVYASGNPMDGSFEAGEIPALRSAKAGWFIVPLRSRHDILMVARTVEVNKETYTIEVGMPVGELDSTLKGLLTALLLGLPIVMLSVSVGGYLLVRRALKPVDDMRTTAMKITFGNLSNRLPVAQTGDALELLSQSLNQMLERLEAAYAQLSRFSIDASHELRTPLTIMKAELESLLNEKSVQKSLELQTRVASMLEEAERLSHIVESLFAISMLDSRETSMNTQLLDMSELVRSVTDQMLLLAEEKNITVSMELEKAVWIKGEKARLKQVIVNVLDNAIKYTPSSGHIRLKVYRSAGNAVLSISDTGIGIPAEALPHVFERFYRADKTRSRSMGGAGLGLSIVRAICLAHGGNVRIESIENKGTTLMLEYPLADETASS